MAPFGVLRLGHRGQYNTYIRTYMTTLYSVSCSNSCRFLQKIKNQCLSVCASNFCSSKGYNVSSMLISLGHLLGFASSVSIKLAIFYQNYRIPELMLFFFLQFGRSGNLYCDVIYFSIFESPFPHRVDSTRRVPVGFKMSASEYGNGFHFSQKNGLPYINIHMIQENESNKKKNFIR